MPSIIFTETWDNYLKFFPLEFKDVYFTEDYVRLYTGKGNNLECFVYMENQGVFLLPYIKRKLSINGEYFDLESPYGYGGAIVNIRDDAFERRAIDSFFQQCRQRKFVAGFVRFHPLLSNHRIWEEKGYAVFMRKTVVMDLQVDERGVWDGIHHHHRRNIKKAQSYGLRYIVDKEFRYIDEFAGMYYATMQRVSADSFYFFPKDYFYRLKTLNNSTFLGIVMKDGEIICGGIFLRYGIYGHYHLGASRYDLRKYRGSNLLFFETAKYLKKEGVKYFHLGGGTDNSASNSLYRFKKMFSPIRRNFFIGRMVFDDTVYASVCREWERKYPEKSERYGRFVLKYRY